MGKLKVVPEQNIEHKRIKSYLDEFDSFDSKTRELLMAIMISGIARKEIAFLGKYYLMSKREQEFIDGYMSGYRLAWDTRKK